MNIQQIEKKLPKAVSMMEDRAKAAVQDAIAVGELLIAAQDIKGKEFQDWLSNQSKVRVDYTQATRYMRIATHKWEALEHSGMSVLELQKVLPKRSEPPRRTEADAKKLGYVGTQPTAVKQSAPSADSWNTPDVYLEAARLVMGRITLDPFSSPIANTRVKAEEFFTEQDDGLEQDWVSDALWMNPPYSRGLSTQAVDKFIAEYEEGNVTQAIILMNASTDSSWFHKLIKRCSAFCLTQGRIAFLGPDGKPSKGNTKGQVFFYFGKRTDEFDDVFTAYGEVLFGRAAA